uniref:BTB domain-containing protein n=1 Tax=Strigamia maritima TaxID=126957 RepID=T1J063_STRMM
MAANKRVRKSDEFNAKEDQQKSLLTNLYNSRDDEKPEKVVLECKDGRVLAHKSILIAGSDYFFAMFSHTNIENETNVASFLDTSVEVMNIVIKFIYAQDIPTRPEITDALISETIIAADKMQLNGLFDEYWNLYSIPITLDKFLNVWQLAEMFNVDETIQNVRIFVLNHMKQISEIDILYDITVTQLENLIVNNVSQLRPAKIGEFITFLLTWGGTKEATETRIDDIINLISKCDIKKLPNHILRNLMSNNQVVVNSAAIYEVLSKEATSRWLTVLKPQIGIYAFVIENGKCEYSVNFLKDLEDVWCSIPKEIHLENWFPAVSRPGAVFFFKFSQFDNNTRGFVAHDETTSTRYNHVEQIALDDSITSETSDYKEIFFRRTSTSYACFNFGQKKWRVINFNDQINDCRCMLLPSDDGKYLFDVDDRHIKIVNIWLGTCVTKEKLPGNWQSIKCRSFDTEPAQKVIFFQKSPNSSLLIYHIESDCWNIVPLPNVRFDVFMYVSFDEECLIFEKTDVAYNVYSLKTMMKLTTFNIPNNFNGCIYFDVSIKMHSLGEA